MVNINDVKMDKDPDDWVKFVEEEFDGNYLQALFAMQRELMHKYHHIGVENGLLLDEGVPVDINSHKGQAQLKAVNSYCVEELYEAMNCLKNKAWKQTTMPTDVAHYKEELIDAMHFFIELLILSDFDWKEAFLSYTRKHAVNKFRQRSNY